ncbi:MAG: MMPL family transporter [Marinilabiliaceae bacterium]
MTDISVKIFDFMRSHKVVCAFSVIALTSLLVMQALRLGYKEDITDFLPLDEDYQNAMRVYEDISGGDKIIAIFLLADSCQGDADDITLAIDQFADLVSERDSSSLIKDILYQVDAGQIEEVTDFVYENIPYFMTDADYARIDSLTAEGKFAQKAMHEAKEQLMLPTGDFATFAIMHDPAGLFSPVMQRLRQTESDLSYEMYDGHIFSPDMSRGIAIATSAAGAMESDKNGALAALLSECAAAAMESNPLVDIHLTGGPVIAAGNSAQIKRDCTVSVAISVVLILLLLFAVFGGLRDMLLIGFSIAWGWLFALGGMSLMRDEMSIIVLGISSVIIGIAVNYPLHYLSHLRHTPDRRVALREIVTPLVVGNVTTVGAFLALVPLNSTALRDLGLFASLMLVGTILFVIVYLPHAAKSHQAGRRNVIDRLCEKTTDNRPVLLWAIGALTVVFGVFSFGTSFDTDMGNINYMTEQQESDIEYFEKQLSKTGPERKIYAIVSDSTPDQALARNERIRETLTRVEREGKASGISYCGDFLCSKDTQEARLRKWDDFMTRKWSEIEHAIARAADEEGFTNEAFEPFYDLREKVFEAEGIGYFATLYESVFASNVSMPAKGKCSIVSMMDVDEGDYDEVKDALSAAGAYAFDVKGMNGTIAERLSDDFNYIGWACGLIVFVFLWLSFGSIELAIISFLPMAVSWVWILGIMAIVGIKFNIVNIILATFIFGQGDDYTIFMTEGASYEYTYRRKMLASYKSSILLSALIMFIGIGTLIVARHPALRSLAEVTIAGMTSVVLMAYVLPPLLFKVLVGHKGVTWRRPISILPLIAGVKYHLTGSLTGIKISVNPESSCTNLTKQSIVTSSTDSQILRDILRRWDYNIDTRGDYKTAAAKGQSVFMGIEEAVKAAEELNLPIRPISIFGIEEIHETKNPCLYSGTVTIRVGGEIQTMGLTPAQLKSICEENDRLNVNYASTPEHFTEMVKDRFRYKEGGIHNAVCSYVKSGDAVRKAYQHMSGSVENIHDDEDYGASAIIAALARPDMKIVAYFADNGKADIARYCADGLASNLEIIVTSKG